MTMNVIQPHKKKYHSLYWQIARAAASQSVAIRRQVGAVIVPPSGIVAIGWNGTPAGFNNKCEYTTFSETEKTITKPEVIHAERNALDKLTRQGVPVNGSILFTTTAPCMECAKSIAAVGITHVYYSNLARYTESLDFLAQAGVNTEYNS